MGRTKSDDIGSDDGGRLYEAEPGEQHHRFDRDHIERTIGPFRQRVRLDALASIEFKQTGTWRSQGMLFVSDTRGHRVGIYVGRFSRAAEWSALLLDAAETTHASVQPRAHGILQRAVANADHDTNRHVTAPHIP
jgi:hypothetical protein